MISLIQKSHAWLFPNRPSLSGALSQCPYPSPACPRRSHANFQSAVPIPPSSCHAAVPAASGPRRPVGPAEGSLFVLPACSQPCLCGRLEHHPLFPLLHQAPPRCSTTTAQITRQHHKILISPAPSRIRHGNEAEHGRPPKPPLPQRARPVVPLVLASTAGMSVVVLVDSQPSTQMWR
jgi:hypothetical protein